ncbi:hypothetical protein J6590_099772, partial [Homalodisca vitripennis]
MYSRGQKPLSRLNFMLTLHSELTAKWQTTRRQNYPKMNLSLKKSTRKLVGAVEEPVNVNA